MGISLTTEKLRLLSALEEKPRHGYELAKDFERHGSTIYQHLHELEDAGYIESEQDERRIIYSVTRKGELLLEAERLDSDDE